MTVVPKIFNFTRAIRLLCEDVCARLPQFSHVDMNRVGVSFSQVRSSEMYGTFAYLTPLRFEKGKSSEVRGNYRFTIPEIRDENNRVLLYLLTICMPRFQNLGLNVKFNTVIHELYHIGEKFDGDIRRFPGRCYAHGSSRKGYNKIIAGFVDDYLAKDPPPELWDFLKFNFAELERQYGRVRGMKFHLPTIRRTAL